MQRIIDEKLEAPFADRQGPCTERRAGHRPGQRGGMVATAGQRVDAGGRHIELCNHLLAGSRSAPGRQLEGIADPVNVRPPCRP